MARPYDLILFDMDGTLYRQNDQCRAVYRQAAIEVLETTYGWSREQATRRLEEERQVYQTSNPGRPSTILVLLSQFPEVTFAAVEDCVSRRHRVEEWLTVDRAAIQAVSQVARHYQTCLFTLNNDTMVERTLTTIGMRDLFPPHRCYSLNTLAALPLPREERLAQVKPGLGGFRLALTERGASPEQSLMVGDSLTSDIEPAQRLGMDTYHVTEIECLYRLPTWLGLDNA